MRKLFVALAGLLVSGCAYYPYYDYDTAYGGYVGDTGYYGYGAYGGYVPSSSLYLFTGYPYRYDRYPYRYGGYPYHHHRDYPRYSHPGGAGRWPGRGGGTWRH